jgi:DNA-binding NarL/FixJ family response regulator
MKSHLKAAVVISDGRRIATRSRLLTRRECEIAKQVLAGKTNREIADTLAISGETVKRHISHIFDKCGVSSRAELAMYLTCGVSSRAELAMYLTGRSAA